MTDEERRRILEEDVDVINSGVELAVALAVEEHRRMGNPIAVWRDGRVVLIPAEEIVPFTPAAGKR